MTRQRHTGRGFTLTEILIALGILGIGLTMASALFPAAIKQEAASIHEAVGSQAAKNGIAVAKSVLYHSRSGNDAADYARRFAGTPFICQTPAGNTHPSVLVGESRLASGFGGANITDSIGGWAVNELLDTWVYCYNPSLPDQFPFFQITGNTANGLSLRSPTGSSLAGASGEYHLMRYCDAWDNQYPMATSGTVGSARGSNLLMRYLAKDNAALPRPLNSYQFVSVAWQRDWDGVNNCYGRVIVVPHLLTGVTTSANNETIITVNDAGLNSANVQDANLVAGSPVIDLESGQYAYCDMVTNPQGTQGRLVHPFSGSTPRWVAVIVQENVTSRVPVSGRSPAINITVSQAALRE